MKIIAGASPEGRFEAGYAGLALVLILLVASLAGVTFVPYALHEKAVRDYQREEASLDQLRRGLVAAIQRSQVIPDDNSWIPAVAGTLGLNPAAIARTLPGFPDDPNPRRLLLIDPRLEPGVLPFTQSVAGAHGPAASLTGRWSRVMLVSSTGRALSLPVSGGRPTAAQFDALWNWRFDERSRQPPAGWPAVWKGQAADLHVARLHLSDLFHQVRFDNVRWALNGSSPSTATNPTSRALLEGGLLEIRTLDDRHVLDHVVRRDAQFSRPAGAGTDPDPP